MLQDLWTDKTLLWPPLEVMDSVQRLLSLLLLITWTEQQELSTLREDHSITDITKHTKSFTNTLLLLLNLMLLKPITQTQ